MFRNLSALALVAALCLPALGGQPGVQVQTVDPCPQPAVQSVQNVTIQCPETYYENEIRTRKVQVTRWEPVTEEVDQEYTVRVAKTRMVPRTVQVACPDCIPQPSTVSVSCPGCLGAVDSRNTVSQTDVEPAAGCLQRLRARRLQRRGRAGL